MTGRRINRHAIRLQPTDEKETRASALPIWNPEIAGARFDLSLLSGCKNGRALVQCLVEWQGRARGGLTVARDVRLFLKFVILEGLAIGPDALVAYRSYLSGDQNRSGTTRRQLFSNAKAFVQQLIRRGVVPDVALPAGFTGVVSTAKATFSELVAEWTAIKLSPDYIAHRADVDRLDLDDSSKDILAANRAWMDALERAARVAVSQRIDDWEFARQQVGMSASVEFRSHWTNDRSIENAIRFLHQLYGRAVPSSLEWPDGLADFCKLRGWPPDRLKAALFMTAKALDPFLVLALANDKLLPNVDSVLRYAFVGCLTKTGDGDLVRVHLGKFRGASIEESFEQTSPLVRAFEALERQVHVWLEEVGGAPPGLDADGGIPLFLHLPPGKRARVVRSFSPDSASDMVRRFIRIAANDNAVLAPLVGKVTGEHFRSTHLLMKRLSGDPIFALQRAAHHANATTTMQYVDRAEVSATAKYRFAHYQGYLISSARAYRLRRLGNGFLCEPQEPSQKTCLQLDACGAGEEGCKARRVVIESLPIVAEWIAWSRHIKHHEAFLRSHHPERWEAVWARRLVEYAVLLEQVSAKVRSDAEGLVSSVRLLPLD